MWFSKMSQGVHRHILPNFATTRGVFMLVSTLPTGAGKAAPMTPDAYMWRVGPIPFAVIFRPTFLRDKLMAKGLG